MSYSKADYEWYKAHHICIRCQSKPAFGNMTKCPECLERDSQNNTDWKARNPGKPAASAKSRYYRLKAEGRCVRCGKPNPNAGTKVRCPACARDDRIRQKTNYVRRIRPDGICRWCNKPVYEDKKLCYEHYLLAAERMRSLKPSNNPNHPWQQDEHARIMKLMAKKQKTTDGLPEGGVKG